MRISDWSSDVCSSDLCSHPLIPNQQCLKVREIQYDAHGLKTGHGDWQAFYSDIQGYTHQPGVRNVLRIRRYERQPVPADASRYAYVLDMVVESAQERSEEHTSELQSLMRTSYAVFCLKKKHHKTNQQ